MPAPRFEPPEFGVLGHVVCDGVSDFGEMARWWLHAAFGMFAEVGGIDVTGPGIHAGWTVEKDTGRHRGPRTKVRLNLDRLERDLGDDAIGVSLDIDLEMSTGSPFTLRLDIEVDDDRSTASVRLVFRLTRFAEDHHLAAIENHLCDLAQQATAEHRYSFVNVSDDNAGRETALDAARLGGLNSYYLRRDAGVLQSYSWVTLVREDLVAALGGVEALRATDAFWSVRPTADGGVLLRATEHLADYTGLAVRRVREALQPVLPTDPTPAADIRSRHLRIAWDDGTNGPFEPLATGEEIRARVARGEPWQPPSAGSA